MKSQGPGDTSWEVSAKSYGALVGQKGSYYHQAVIFPNLLQLMAVKPSDTVLELGCGQGVLSRLLPPQTTYFGLDASETLIKEAQKRKGKHHAYFKFQDVTRPFKLTKSNFKHVVIILALQNMRDLEAVIANAKTHLHPKGKLWIVLNHPAFRIPKNSEWVTEEKRQSRLVHAYMSPQKIPIDMNPGAKTQKKTTWSFHRPLSGYMAALKAHKLAVVDLQEWVSDKESEGKNAARENKARDEIPMFMLLVAMIH